MQAREIRKRFLEFFRQRGHSVVPSSSLIPENDPSVLLTTAGMQQFKAYFTGQKDPIKDFGSQRTASVQKSFRTTDIESVGDESHLTFFEMLGNFSFGPIGADDPADLGAKGYFKRAAIAWGNEFITKELGLKIDYVSVFGGAKTPSGQEIPADIESEKIWRELGFTNEKIRRHGIEDNFWGPTGDQGPCGPTTEIYLKNLEVWNIVFNEYFYPGSRDELTGETPEKNLQKLKNPGVDTGMGLERLALVLQGAESVFETDLFEAIVGTIRGQTQDFLSGFDRQIRILADHGRASFFLIADGVIPSNLDRGYILRRLIRRAMLQAKTMNLAETEWPAALLAAVNEIYGDVYPEVGQKERILPVFQEEREKFSRTLERGMRLFDKIATQFPGRPGLFAFEMLQSHGLPLDVTKDLLAERGMAWQNRDEVDFYESFQKHQEISRAIKS